MSAIHTLLGSLPYPLSSVVLLLSSIAFLIFFIANTIYNLFFHPLSSIPGPLFARITPFYPLYCFYRGDFATHVSELHARHGEHVRIAPNHVAIATPHAYKQLWTNKDFEKGDFYDAFVLGLSKHRDLFTIRQNTFHSQRKRIHAHAWSMTSVLEMESYIDDVVGLFMQKVGRLADDGVGMDLGMWTWRFTYDVIGELFFGISFGFLEQERDIDGLMAAGGAVAPFEGLTGMAPPWFKPLLVSMMAIPSIARGVINMQRMKAKGKKMVADRMKQVQSGTQTRKDMLGKLLRISWEKGDKYDWTVQDVEQECLVAMVAGNDTASITLTSIFYHLATHPESLSRLQQEIDEATTDGALSSTISFKEASLLPYLSAVINEGFRIHPLTGYPVPRVVPKGGAEVGGRWWPAGTVLGASFGTIEKSEETFGPDAQSWRPDRWLVEKEKAARMWEEVGAFGLGQRACLGQHIARSEVTKLVPQFVREFNIEATTPWRSLERWFNKPQQVQVKVTRRKK